jgi:hypothetical protein
MTDMLLSIDPENFSTEIANIINDANDGVIKAIRRDMVEPLKIQLAAIEARLAGLEQRAELKYCGIWQHQQYERGSFVTMNGALWHCEMKTTSRPGCDSSWRLAVKSAVR